MIIFKSCIVLFFLGAFHKPRDGPEALLRSDSAARNLSFVLRWQFQRNIEKVPQHGRQSLRMPLITTSALTRGIQDLYSWLSRGQREKETRCWTQTRLLCMRSALSMDKVSFLNAKLLGLCEVDHSWIKCACCVWLSFLHREPSLKYQKGHKQMQSEIKRDFNRLIREDAVDLSRLRCRYLVSKTTWHDFSMQFP